MVQTEAEETFLGNGFASCDSQSCLSNAPGVSDLSWRDGLFFFFFFFLFFFMSFFFFSYKFLFVLFNSSLFSPCIVVGSFSFFHRVRCDWSSMKGGCQSFYFFFPELGLSDFSWRETIGLFFPFFSFQELGVSNLAWRERGCWACSLFSFLFPKCVHACTKALCFYSQSP